MTARLALLLLLLASPAWAQPPCVVTHPAKGDIRVKCGEVEIGQREHPDGRREHLTRGRSLKAFGLVKTWQSKEVRTQDFPRELDPVPSGPLASATPAPAIAFDGLVTHDVGIYWTPRVEAARGGPSGALALATLAVAIANQTYVNSGVSLQLRLVDARRVAFVESPEAGTQSISTDLMRLQGKGVTSPRDGSIDTALDEIHGYRDQVGVDIVTLFGEGYAAKGACGVGYLNSTAATAFNVVDASCAVGRPSYGHEVGHNQGLNHDPQTACGQPVCAGYNYGSNFGTLGTMMSYLGSRVRYISNPNVIHPGNGLPTGIANQRDNARMLKSRAAVVAAFTAAVVAQAPQPQTPEGPPYVLDHLCVYTTPAKALLGGEDQARNRCQINIDLMNQALTANGLAPTYSHRLLGTFESPAPEQIRWEAAQAQQVSNTAIAAERDRIGADVIDQLQTSMTACGVATTNLTGGSLPYLIVALLCDTQTFTGAHEVAHLGGVQHDRAHATSGAPLKPYGYGYVGPVFRDVMAYPVGTTVRQNVYSSPSGIGTATDDAARAFREQFPTMTTWRTPQIALPAEGRPAAPTTLRNAGALPSAPTNLRAIE